MAQKKNARKRSRPQAQQRHARRPARANRDTAKPEEQVGLSNDEWADFVQHFYRRRHRQKIWGAVLLIMGVMTIVNHLFEHTDSFDVLGSLFSSSAQDIVAGFPIGAAMIVGAAILFGQLDNPPSRSVVAGQRRSR